MFHIVWDIEVLWSKLWKVKVASLSFQVFLLTIIDCSEGTDEFEFSMIDVEDYEGLQGYIKRYGLADTSMTEERKAKRLGINVIKDEEGNIVDNGDAPGELEAAAQQMEEDDEDEGSAGEDYNPGSEGESEGSGTSDEDDEEEGGGGGGGADEQAEEDGDGEMDLWIFYCQPCILLCIMNTNDTDGSVGLLLREDMNTKARLLELVVRGCMEYWKVVIQFRNVYWVTGGSRVSWGCHISYGKILSRW